MISKEKINEIFGDWSEPLLKIDGFKENLEIVLKDVFRDIKSGIKVYPEKENIFRIFKELKYNDVKVVMIAQDPYHDGSADGF